MTCNMNRIVKWTACGILAFAVSAGAIDQGNDSGTFKPQWLKLPPRPGQKVAYTGDDDGCVRHGPKTPPHRPPPPLGTLAVDGSDNGCIRHGGKTPPNTPPHPAPLLAGPAWGPPGWPSGPLDPSHPPLHPKAHVQNIA